MNEFLDFKKMVTPTLVKILFWIGILLCVFTGLFRMFSGQFFAGILTLLVGPLVVRVYCELLIVIFSIHDTLTDVKNMMMHRAASPETP